MLNRSHHRPSWTLPSLLILLTVLIGLAIVGPFRFGYFSLCSVCGRWRTTNKRQAVPLLGCGTYWTSHTERPTPFSELLETLGTVPEHPHQWVFGWGAGNGIQCAIGDGRDMDQTTREPRVLRFITDLHHFRSPDDVRQWTAKLLGKHSWNYRSLLTRYPEEGRSESGDFEELLADIEEWEKRYDLK